MTQPIIVGIDGNSPAEQAARVAAGLARALGSPLHVVCAYARNQEAEVEANGQALRVSVAQESADIAARAALELGDDGLATSSAAVLGRPAEALVAEAERLGASVIVVGNKRMQGPSRVLGSVASAVAHHAPCDVYIAHTN